MKKILTFICLILSLLISSCDLDLSHKHCYDDCGLCNCGEDIAEELIYSNETYNSTTYDVEQGQTYYYKFKAHGENGIYFNLESENVVFNRIEIRSNNMVQAIATRKDYNDKLYMYNKTFNNDVVFYLKITYTGTGTIKLVLNKIA